MLVHIYITSWVILVMASVVMLGMLVIVAMLAMSGR